MARPRSSTCPHPRRGSRAVSLAGTIVLLALVWALTGLSSAARADVFGPDESIGTAGGPLQPGVTYSGAFSTADDVDYLAFDVTQPGETLHFDIVNTLPSCNDPYNNNCPMWGTLIDGNGQQLGGEGSFAGTGEVDYSSSDAIDWTFATPGRYYLVLDQSGDFVNFQLGFHVVSSGGGGGGGGGSSAGGGGSSAGGGGSSAGGGGSTGGGDSVPASGGGGFAGAGASGGGGPIVGVITTGPGAGRPVVIGGPGALVSEWIVQRRQMVRRP